jgi:hypothetical protein
MFENQTLPYLMCRKKDLRDTEQVHIARYSIRACSFVPEFIPVPADIKLYIKLGKQCS